MNEKKILIVIPTYNEGLIIEEVISEINTIFEKFITNSLNLKSN